MVRTTVYLPDELHRSLKISAAKSGKSITELIITALGRDTSENIPPVKTPRTIGRTKNVDNMCKHGFLKGLCKYGCK